jgi:hypothetical protein
MRASASLEASDARLTGGNRDAGFARFSVVAFMKMDIRE